MFSEWELRLIEGTFSILFENLHKFIAKCIGNKIHFIQKISKSNIITYYNKFNLCLNDQQNQL